MTVRRGFRVEGRVQGVGFRWWTRRLAQDLGLQGDVRNRRDGSVAVQATGNEDAIAALETSLWRGPPGARVDSVQVIPAAGQPPGTGFTIEGR